MTSKGRRKKGSGWQRLLDKRIITPAVSLALFAGMIFVVFFDNGGKDVEKVDQTTGRPTSVVGELSDQMAEGDDPIGDHL